MNKNLNSIRLTTHFSLTEAFRSETAERLKIDNTPPDDVILTMKQTAFEIELLRSMLGVPLQINSWYRCPELNRALGSKDTSQHILGEAVDFVAPHYGSPLAICKFILSHSSNIPFDQLILEHSWIHISFAIHSGKPRNQVLSLLKNGHYAQGLTDADGKVYT